MHSIFFSKELLFYLRVTFQKERHFKNWIWSSIDNKRKNVHAKKSGRRMLVNQNLEDDGNTPGDGCYRHCCCFFFFFLQSLLSLLHFAWLQYVQRYCYTKPERLCKWKIIANKKANANVKRDGIIFQWEFLTLHTMLYVEMEVK